MLIEWTDKYSTGVKELDDQHKEIINQLNRLHEALTSGLGKDVIMEILEFAGDYASKHFAYEEDCMNRHRCPVAQKNRQAHDEFIDRFIEIKEELAKSGVGTAAVLDVYRELREWIKNHILKIDTHLRSCVSSGEEPVVR